MICNHSASWIPAYLDGRLNPARCAELEAHLEACSRCRDVVAAQREVAQALASRPEEPAPPWLAQRVAVGIEEESGWYGVADFRWLTVRLAPVTAALLIVAAVLTGNGSAQPITEERVSLAQVVETWADGSGEAAPAPSVLWKQDVSKDSLLLTVLAAPPDATIGGQSDGR